MFAYKGNEDYLYSDLKVEVLIKESCGYLFSRRNAGQQKFIPTLSLDIHIFAYLYRCGAAVNPCYVRREN